MPSATCFRMCFQWQSALEPETWSSLLQTIAGEKIWYRFDSWQEWLILRIICLAASTLVNIDFGTLVNMRALCLPGAGPCLRQWMRDVSDGAWASNQHAWIRAVQPFWLRMQTKVTWLLHSYIRSIWLRSTCSTSKGFSWSLPSNGRPRGWVTGLAHMPSLRTLSELNFSDSCRFWNH